MADDVIKNRSEIIFVYETNNNNPNGDPLTENRPRMDEILGKCMVSDVRLKRNVRDYLLNAGHEIFVADWVNDDGTIKMSSDRVESLGPASMDYEDVFKRVRQCTDVRLFGCVAPLGKKKRSVQITGPTHFLYGRSMHRVAVMENQGTAAFASTSGAQNRSFRMDYIIPFALIKFYGMIHEGRAEKSGMTTDDLTLLDDAVWEGTKGLQSRTKIGHNPRLYLRVEYKEGESHVGLLHNALQLEVSEEVESEDEIREISEVSFNYESLLQQLAAVKDTIYVIHYRVNANECESLSDLIAAIEAEDIPTNNLAK